MSNDMVKLFRAMEIFREFDTAFPMSYAAAFLTVANDPGLPVSEYAKKLGVGQAQTSRMLLEIGSKSRHGGAGRGWIHGVIDGNDMRIKRLQLTPHGEILRQRIVAALR